MPSTRFPLYNEIIVSTVSHFSLPSHSITILDAKETPSQNNIWIKRQLFDASHCVSL